jgi:hypothetical protein
MVDSRPKKSPLSLELTKISLKRCLIGVLWRFFEKSKNDEIVRTLRFLAKSKFTEAVTEKTVGTKFFVKFKPSSVEFCPQIR